jgi:uracil-DNA glycosylase
MKFELENSWLTVLDTEFQKSYITELWNRVEQAYEQFPEQIFPVKDEIFNAFNFCSFESVKVVIIGQDPYPTKGHAHGLCFSVDKDVKPLPKSLMNVFKELETDLNQSAPSMGNLEHWAKQGVLLLNTALTVKEGEAGSHTKLGWDRFTDAVINVLNSQKSHVVYILWGSKAQKKGVQLDRSQNLVIESPHPSPLSSYRGFFGSKPFSKTNAYLISVGKEGINW